MRRILVAHDGSKHADRALAWAKELARLVPGAELYLVAATAPYVSELEVLPEEHQRLEQQVQSAITRRLARLEKQLEMDGYQVISHCRDGRPAEVILEVADAVGADLVVVGSRGLSGVGRLLLGSVSAEVVGHARCPVTVVH